MFFPAVLRFVLLVIATFVFVMYLEKRRGTKKAALATAPAKSTYVPFDDGGVITDVIREMDQRRVLVMLRQTVRRQYPKTARVPLGGRWKTFPVAGGNRRGISVTTPSGTVFRRASQVRAVV